MSTVMKLGNASKTKQIRVTEITSFKLVNLKDKDTHSVSSARDSYQSSGDNSLIKLERVELNNKENQEVGTNSSKSHEEHPF